MTDSYPYDVRQIEFLNDAEFRKYLMHVHYVDEARSYLAWIRPNLCYQIRKFISISCSIPLSSVILVGSARLGFSTKNNLPFEMGFSDLDIAVVNSEVIGSLKHTDRKIDDLAASLPIRPDYHLDNSFCALALSTAKRASQVWASEFSAISISIYPSLDAVVMRTAVAMRRWRELSNASAGPKGQATYQLQASRIQELASANFRIFQRSIEKSSPNTSGPHALSYELARSLILSMKNREALVCSLEKLITELRRYIKPEALMIGGSAIIPGVKTPHDIDCALFYSARDSEKLDLDIEGSMKWVRKYRQNGVDIRLIPVDGPMWITIKLAGYMTALFSSSRNGINQGPIIIGL